MCFRIVRIEGDGSIKLILASELECSETNLTNDSGYATDGAKGVKGNLITAHYGYKKIASVLTRYANDYINSEDKENSARVKLNEWLERKITNESDLALLKSDIWCIGDLTNGYDVNSNGNIIGKIDDLIKANTSFTYISRIKYDVTKTPSYKCTTTGVDGETDINKVGMLTFDEVVYAGGGSVTNSNYYLINNATTKEWYTLNPFAYDETSTTAMWAVNITGELDFIIDINQAYNGLRPVLTLKSSVKITSGDGTITNPYKVS